MLGWHNLSQRCHLSPPELSSIKLSCDQVKSLVINLNMIRLFLTRVSSNRFISATFILVVRGWFGWVLFGFGFGFEFCLSS